MADLVEIAIPVDPAAARALGTSARREAAGRYLSTMLRRGGVQDALSEAIEEAKQEAQANGLTDEEVDRELEAWRALPSN